MSTVIKKASILEDSQSDLSNTSTGVKEELIPGESSVPIVTHTEVTEEESEPAASHSCLVIKEEYGVDRLEYNGSDVQTASTEEVFLNEPIDDQYIDECFHADPNEEDCIKGCYSEENMMVNEFKSDSCKLLRQDMIIKEFVCNMCGKAFIQLRNLTRHKIIHSGIKRHQCNICKKRFTQSNNLSRHKLTHSEKKYQCSVCYKYFSLDYLPSHKTVHSSVKKYKCNVCDKSFAWAGCLRRHKVIHINI